MLVSPLGNIWLHWVGSDVLPGVAVSYPGLFSLGFGQKFGFANFHAFFEFEKCRLEFGQSSMNFKS